MNNMEPGYYVVNSVHDIGPRCETIEEALSFMRSFRDPYDEVMFIIRVDSVSVYRGAMK